MFSAGGVYQVNKYDVVGEEICPIYRIFLSFEWKSFVKLSERSIKRKILENIPFRNFV